MAAEIDDDLPRPSAHTQEFLDDPQPWWARMRERRPVIYGPDIASTTTRAAFDELVHRRDDFISMATTDVLGLERPMIPLAIDQPAHATYRRLLDPIFSRREMDRLEPAITADVNQLIDGFIDRDGCDFTHEFAVPLPTRLFLRMFGAPESDLDELLELNHRWVRPEASDMAGVIAGRTAAAREIFEYLNERLDDHEASPRDDVLSHLIEAEVDGHKLTREELLDIGINLLIGGLDTVTATLTCVYAFLATNPGHRQMLVEDPSLIPGAIEELLRRESPAFFVFRMAINDTELQGCPIKAGTLVTGYVGAANADPAVFENPADVDFMREGNRHVAFGGGIHRCLGSHLARLELNVAMREWHKRIPGYSIAPNSDVHYYDNVRSVQQLMLEFQK